MLQPAMFDESMTRREVLKRTAASIAALSVNLQFVSAFRRTSEPDWPMNNGPFGNFNPRRYGHRLVDDLAKTRLLWRSEDHFGFGKGGASSFLSDLIIRPTHPGSCFGPIIADGLIFVSSFQPSGRVWAENLPHLKNFQKPIAAEQRKKLQQQLRIGADDLLIALDQRTGKTVWKAVEEGKGLNRYMGKRLGFGVAPAWLDGKVFNMGTTGRLYAYEARSGNKLWETDLGKTHLAMEARKKKCLDAKTLLGYLGWDASLVVADGVLVVPLFDAAPDVSLRGVDPMSGKTLWEIPAINCQYATPAVLHYEQREYLLVATSKGSLHMIDPRRGKVLWTVDKLAPNWASLTCSADHVIVNIGSQKAGPKRGIHFGLYGAYRFSPKGAQRAWSMQDRTENLFVNWMDSCARRAVVMRDGLVYLFCSHHPVDGKQHLHVIEEKTGKLLHSEENDFRGSMMLLVEDRLIKWCDAAHKAKTGGSRMEMFSADPSNFKRLGSIYAPPEAPSTGYEVYMEYPYADGCLFQRTETGHLCCYDLRKGT
ncbi:MAG: hypothetical protein KatS3mg105_2671 [Gemmatales bacterium]|nr:MAG: hypothetical protein KatS3mg105_2671 [Gemmatales bacterium]